jgi:hypothetical protein
MIMTHESLKVVGGWNSHFYGGEDTNLCTRLRAAGFSIAHSPNTVVYHYRRSVFLKHWRQIGNVGRHRGHFKRTGDLSSKNIIFMLPSFVPLFLGVLIIATVVEGLSHPLATSLVMLGSWIFISLLTVKKLGLRMLFFPAALIMHHLSYGTNFIRGLALKTIDDNLEPK